MKPLDAALRYASIAWRVFPLQSLRDGICTCRDGAACTSPGKHPRTKNGLHDATVDVDKIQRWWRRWPSANIGVVTGAASGIVVVDVDGDAGVSTLRALVEAHADLPGTVLAATGGGGRHHVFRHPGGVEIRNTAGDRGKLGDHLDFRGDGGYIVVAPSRHVSGDTYDWVASPFDTELADLPAWLLARLLQPKPVERPTPPAREDLRDGGTKFGAAALARELEALAATGQGGRNHALNAAAFNLGQLVAGGELDEASVVAELTAVALGIGLGAGETEKTIASGLRKGQATPRSAPPRDTPPSGRHLRSVPNTPDDAPPPAPPRSIAPAAGEGGPPRRFMCTDLGNAKRLIRTHGHDLHYVPAWGAWLIWDGRRWQRDGTGEIMRRAKHIVENIINEINEAPDDSDRKKDLRWWWKKSQSERSITAAVKLAQSEPGISVQTDDLDADPWALNVRNGVVDLRTGELHPHDRGRLITKIAPVNYDPNATLDVWDRFLETATEDDDELRSFLQRAAGYTLTGNTGEEVLFFAHGPAASGKSTFLEALRSTLGEYASVADFETFLRQQNAGGPRNDIARLVGARLVVSIEVDEGRRLAEGLIKTITGGDTVTARFLNREFFEFRPAFKLWLAANDAPRVSHDDEAMWRRILRFPFENVIPKERRDPAIKASLRDPRKSGSAILAWAVRGCLEWQREGLNPPERVAAATQAYRDDMDDLRDFLEDRCYISTDAWAFADDLYHVYREWTKEAGLRWPMSQKSLGTKLKKKGFKNTKRRVSGVSRWYWVGVGIIDEGTLDFGDHPPLIAEEPAPDRAGSRRIANTDPARPNEDEPAGHSVADSAAPDRAGLITRYEQDVRARREKPEPGVYPARSGAAGDEGTCEHCRERAAHRHKNGSLFRDADGRAICRECIDRIGNGR